MFSRNFTIFFVAVLLSASFAYVSFAYAETADFFIDGSFDWQGRGETTAELRHEGSNAKWYVADDYWSSLNSSQRINLSVDIKNLSYEFDNTVYPQLTAIFGFENNPGVDGDPKITVLLTRMIDEAGGYFKEQDGVSKAEAKDSNEREMVYLNVIHASNVRMRAFLAHEFQHLITFNQKYIKHRVQEEVWMNELRSEIAPTLIGYDALFVYSGSNLQARLAKFLRNSSDAILNWNSEEGDYASINLFSQYILDHYGRSVFAAMTQNEFVGIESFNSALKTFGFSVDFSDVYTNWTVSNLVNNCSIQPVNLFCYKNPLLNYENLHIIFDGPDASGGSISSKLSTEGWKSAWFEYATDLKAVRPDDNIFKMDFDAEVGSKFRVPYVIYDKDGSTVKEVREFVPDSDGNGTFYVPDFGFTVPRIVIIPSNQVQSAGVIGIGAVTTYGFNASTVTYIPDGNSAINTQVSDENIFPLQEIPDGTLIRASNDYKVYIVNGKYRRWIQGAEIFNFYSHMSFDGVKVVSPEILALYKDSWLVRADGDTKVYEINGDGTRHWLDMPAEEFSISGRRWDMVYVVNRAELNWYVEGEAVR